MNNKPHFELLDGLRGIAALAVVTFHFTEMIIGNYSVNFIGHGFLAVDFFFCLSGFVIGYAYDDHIAQLGIWEFVKLRLIRLHPLVILGSLIGLIAFLYDPFPAGPDTYKIGRILLMLIASMLIIPYPVMGERGFNLFSFNAPAWSLFWEYIANLVYVLILSHLQPRVLIGLVFIAGAGIVWVTYQSGNMMGGWSGGTFWHGGLRIAYSFTAGLIIYRLKWIITSSVSFSLLGALLMLAFVMPFSSWNWLSEPLVILIYFPFLITLGAGARLRPNSLKICRFCGQVSYPLYMTHYAVIWIFGHYGIIHEPSMLLSAVIIGAAMLVLVGFAYLVMKYFDEPARKYLTERTQPVRSLSSRQ